jgi:hypothetical protein
VAEYFSFEDVMKELELGEEDLKRMVSEGELRAFRDENKMKFKKEDVESLKKGRITEPTIILPSTPTSEVTDETVLDLDIGQETAALSDVTGPTVEMSEPMAPPPRAAREPAPAAAQTDEDLIIQPEEVGVESEETFIEEEGDTGLTTEPLKLAEDSEGEATVEAEAVTEDMPAAGKARAPRAGRVSARVPVAVEEEIEKKRAHWIWTLFILLAFVASAYSGLFFYDMMRMELGKTDQPSGLTSGMARYFLDQFWQDKEWRKFHEREYPDSKQPPFAVEVNGEIRMPHQSYNGQTAFPQK